MNDNATNLDRLHDIILPAPVPWWPPAPGWYVVLAVVVCLALAFSIHWWRTWRANAYRRVALRELACADSASAISELLRRAALVPAPRGVIAALSGPAWPRWLADQLSEPMPYQVREQLTAGVYAQREAAADLSALREFAAQWILRHKVPAQPGHR